MSIKSILVKSMMAATIAVTGLVALDTTANKADAAVVNNDAQVVTINYTKTPAISVWNNYENPVKTGQQLKYGTAWKVIKTAYDHNGNKWYDLGKNQWVMAKYTDHADGQAAGAGHEQGTAIQRPAATTASSAVSSNTSSSALSGSEASARAWIAARESGGSYSARNGQYIGKYQLSASYLNGDYSAANQDRVANNYVKSRYGSWRAAQSFWQSHGWY